MKPPKSFKLTPSESDRTAVISFRIPALLKDRLERLATDNRMSMSTVAIQCIEYALENMEQGR